MILLPGYTTDHTAKEHRNQGSDDTYHDRNTSTQEQTEEYITPLLVSTQPVLSIRSNIFCIKAIIIYINTAYDRYENHGKNDQYKNDQTAALTITSLVIHAAQEITTPRFLTSMR